MRKKNVPIFLSLFLVLIIHPECRQYQNSGTILNKAIQFNLQTRDFENNVNLGKREIKPENTAIVIVDAWDSHWCITWTHHADATVPRLKKTLEYARRSGFQIIWCPSDVTNQYVGCLPRELALATPYVNKVPRIREISMDFKFPYAELSRNTCNCGPGIRCPVHYGIDGMNPSLTVKDDDYIVRGTREMYSVCLNEGITNLIYAGWATNMCLWGKPSGIKAMYEAGLNTILARDLTDAYSNYIPSKNFTPDDGTAISIRTIEKGGIPSVNLFQELISAGQFKDEDPVDMVRLSPWGTKDRVYLFDENVTIIMRIPNQENVVIRYTLDGIAPDEKSPAYTRAVVVDKTTEIKAAAFRDGKMASLVSEAYYVKENPQPPKPDICLDEIETIPDQYYPGFEWKPKKNKNFEGKELVFRDEKFEQGMGFRAPGHLQYDIRPEWKRFVATGAVDTRMIDKTSPNADENYGIFKALYPSVKFMVFIDGLNVMDSPVMVIGQEWRINVEIPQNSRIINIVVHDAGTRNVLDLANLLDAGFCYQ